MRQSFWKSLAAWLSFLLIFMASLVPNWDETAQRGGNGAAPSPFYWKRRPGQ